MRLLLEWTSPGLSLESGHRECPGLVSDLPLNSQEQVILTTWCVSESISVHQSPGPGLPKLQLEKESLSHPNLRLNLPDFISLPLLRKDIQNLGCKEITLWPS